MNVSDPSFEPAQTLSGRVRWAVVGLLALSIATAILITSLVLAGLSRQESELERVRERHVTSLLALNDLTDTIAHMQLAERDVLLAGETNAASRSLDTWRQSAEQSVAIISDLSTRSELPDSLQQALVHEREALVAYAERSDPVLNIAVNDPEVDLERIDLALVSVRPFVRDVEDAVDTTRVEVQRLDSAAAADAASAARTAQRQVMLACGVLLLLLAGIGLAMAGRASRWVSRLGLLSGSDPLTGLLNRQGLANAYRRERFDQPSDIVSAVYVDIDHFSLVNSLMSPEQSDALLQSIAQVICDLAPSGSLIARAGGDEFVTISQSADEARAERYANEVVESLRSLPISQAEPFLHLTVSAGVFTARGPDSPVALGDLLLASSEARVVAQERGRDQVYVATIEGTERRAGHEAPDHVETLVGHLADGHLRLVGCPMSTSDDRPSLAGFKLGIFTPETGKVAEASSQLETVGSLGIRSVVDRWMLTAALLLLESDHLAADIIACIPLSASSIGNRGFATFAERILDEHPDTRARLAIECDHRALVNAPAARANFAETFAARDLKLVLNGFSPTHASFGLLSTPGLIAIGLSGDFGSADLETSHLASGFSQIAAEWGVATIATGVDDEASLEALVAAGVAYASGKAVGGFKPIEAGELWRLASALSTSDTDLQTAPWGTTGHMGTSPRTSQ